MNKGEAAISTMKDVLDAARTGDLAKALAAGSVAADAMAAATDPDRYSDAGGALGAAFDTVKASLLASDPHLAQAVSAHKAKLTGRGA